MNPRNCGPSWSLKATSPQQELEVGPSSVNILCSCMYIMCPFMYIIKLYWQYRDLQSTHMGTSYTHMVSTYLLTWTHATYVGTNMSVSGLVSPESVIFKICKLSILNQQFKWPFMCKLGYMENTLPEVGS